MATVALGLSHQATSSILTMVNSHLDGWKTTTLTQRHKPYSTSQKMEDLYDTHDYKAKHNYPSIKTQNPKGLGNPIKAYIPMSELEEESI
jgi:hypothetical protein